jgi:hypothetical protein
MINIEIIGNEEAITAVKTAIALPPDTEMKQYRQRSMEGWPDIIGLVMVLSPVLLPHVFEIAKSSVIKDRDLKIKVNDLEIVVRNVSEASHLMDVLAARGIFPKKDHKCNEI